MIKIILAAIALLFAVGAQADTAAKIDKSSMGSESLIPEKRSELIISLKR
jgi:hypothetical protein